MTEWAIRQVRVPVSLKERIDEICDYLGIDFNAFTIIACMEHLESARKRSNQKRRGETD